MSRVRVATWDATGSLVPTFVPHELLLPRASLASSRSGDPVIAALEGVAEHAQV